MDDKTRELIYRLQSERDTFEAKLAMAEEIGRGLVAQRDNYRRERDTLQQKVKDLESQLYKSKWLNRITEGTLDEVLNEAARTKLELDNLRDRDSAKGITDGR